MGTPLRVSLAVVASLTMAACGAGTTSPSGTTAPAAPPKDVDEVYSRAEATLRSMGVVHVSILATYEQGSTRSGTDQLWLDVAGNRYREHALATTTDPSSATPITSDRTSIGTSAGVVTGSVTEPARTCRGVGVPTSRLLGCPNALETSTTTLAPADPVDGHAAVALETNGTMVTGDATVEFTSRIVVDASSCLPISSTGQGTIDTGERRTFSANGRFTYEQVAASSLDDRWFDPATLGTTG